MRRVIVAILSMVIVATSQLVVVGAPKGRSSSVIYVSGERYYLHTVKTGETLYSLAKLYEVDERDILTENPTIRNGFNVGLNIKIPYPVKPVKKLTEKQLRKSFDLHTIRKGETLYSISRRYEISVEMIMEDNPNLDPTNLAIGDKLNIRKSEQGLADEQQIVAEIKDYRDQLNKVVGDDLVYYLVKEGDTLGSLVEQFDMKDGEIEGINNLPEGREVAVGTLILVNDMADDSSSSGGDRVMFAPLNEDETLKVSLLLPLSYQGDVMNPMFELYQGFLLGVEDVKREGRSVEINLFDTEVSADKVAQIVDSERFRSSDLVVGPIFDNLLSLVVDSISGREVPVVAPLPSMNSNTKHPDSERLFNMASEESRRYDKIDDLLSDDYRVVVIYGEKNDMAYVEQIESMLERREKVYHRYQYKYEHPSEISEREKMAERRKKQAEEEAEILGFDGLDEWALDTLYLPPSPSDLTPLMLGTIFDVDSLRVSYAPMVVEVDSMVVDSMVVDSLAIEPMVVDSLAVEVEKARATTLIFVFSDSETEVDRILSALASSYTLQASKLRGSGRKASEEFGYRVVANPDWSRYENIDRTLYFRNRVTTFSSYVAGRDSEAVRDFDSRYSAAFNDFPSDYAYRGYDVARIFVEGMYGDIQNNMEGKVYQPLQSEYLFDRVDSLQSRHNINWNRVDYRTNFTRTIE